MRPMPLRRALSTLALLALPLGACGPGEEPTDGPDGTATPTAVATPTATAAATPTRTQPAVTPTPTQARTPTPTQARTPTPTRVPTPPPTPTPTAELEPLKIAKTSPDDGAWAFDAAARNFVVYFNRPFPEGFSALDDVSLVLSPVGGGPAINATAVSFVDDSEGVRFSASSVVPGTAYDFDVAIDMSVPAADYGYDGTFTTEVPCGVGFDLADRAEARTLEFTQFGNAGRAQLGTLNAGINGVPQDLVALFDGVYNGEPLPLEGPNAFTAVIGSIIPINSSSGSIDSSLGFATSIDGCNVNAGGNLFCSGDLLVVPLNTGATSRKELANIYLRDVSVSGLVTAGSPYTFTGLNISGKVGQTDIERFLSEAGTAVDTVLGPILGNQSNYDTAWNGEPALSIVMTASPVPFTLTGCSTDGPQ